MEVLIIFFKLINFITFIGATIIIGIDLYDIFKHKERSLKYKLYTWIIFLVMISTGTVINIYEHDTLMAILSGILTFINVFIVYCTYKEYKASLR